MKNEKQPERHKGIVHRLEPHNQPTNVGGDVTFSPDYTVTSTTDGGGRVLTDVEVILCFWGTAWNSNPPPSPSRTQIETAIIGILTGPFMGGLRQYRGVGQGSIIFSEINASSDPANGYTNGDLVNMLKDRIDNAGMPGPQAGHNRFYAVFPPQGVNNSITKFVGQHQSFTHNGQTGYYCWVDNNGSLTGGNSVTKVFSHELVEACTNPDVDTSNDSILVNGTNPDGSSVKNDEIGDTCNGQFATLDMNGITCSVEAYWSKADNLCILPTGTLEFWVDKSSFGKDEVQDVINTSGGKFEQAFWLVVEGFSKDTFAALNVSLPNPTGPFVNLSGVSITQNPDIDFENAADPAAQQRIRVPFDITFSSAALADFPASGSQLFQANAFIAINGSKVPGTDASTEFELVAGADPYFTNIDPTQDNVFYLSQDLRVFTATPKLNTTPVAGGPSFDNDNPDGAFTYIQQLLDFLNNNFNDPAGADPFNSILPSQGSALQADSSVTPFTVDLSNIFFPKIFNNYNFAVARVRLRGSSGAAGQAGNTRVFFRMWTTQTPDTDYQTSTTYPFNPDAAGLPGSPQVGADHITLPFFATGNFGSNTDYDPGGVNNRDIEIPDGRDSTWAYFGCFLNLYDSANVLDGKQIQGWLNGNHHCIVAQIAFDGAEVFSGANPESSDKLAQRNLQITHSDNPGPASTHRIPQTFDIRPSEVNEQATEVDELMIDWGAIPKGSVASIYWPQVQASEVLALASQLYPRHSLKASDANTVQVKVTGGVTYVPIPKSAGENFAGLLTVDLPTTVVTGQEFDVVVRRIGTRQPPPIILLQRREKSENIPPQLGNWRYVIGTFQVKIPVTTAEVMLFPEENTLAIMKWRLQQVPPGNRWYPVLKRYISFIADRVKGLGGDPDAIPPSPDGAPVRTPKPCEDVVEYTGRVAEIIFDCYGDLEGFVLADCCSIYSFKTREKEIGEIVLRACKDHFTVSVFVPRTGPRRIQKVVIRC
ncbi:MAG TPA: hypothetical protein VH437_14040 [Terriglobales bacterium]|jgi:hypothetical protein